MPKRRIAIDHILSLQSKTHNIGLHNFLTIIHGYHLYYCVLVLSFELTGNNGTISYCTMYTQSSFNSQTQNQNCLKLSIYNSQTIYKKWMLQM